MESFLRTFAGMALVFGAIGGSMFILVFVVGMMVAHGGWAAIGFIALPAWLALCFEAFDWVDL